MGILLFLVFGGLVFAVMVVGAIGKVVAPDADWHKPVWQVRADRRHKEMLAALKGEESNR